MNKITVELDERSIEAIARKVFGHFQSNGNGEIDEPPFLSMDEASNYVNLTKSTLYGLVHRKKIPFHKKNRKLYFLKSELSLWIKGEYVEKTSTSKQAADEYLLKNQIF